MNIDDLKTTWKEYDKKLASTQDINKHILLSMIKDRSDNRFAGVKKYYQAGMLWMFICLAFGIMILVGNPFDYQYMVQFIPVVIFITGLAILLTDMIRSYSTFQKISLTHYNVDESLRRIIAVYEKPKKYLSYVVIIFLFSQVVLFPLSFLPKGIERMGLGTALLERLIPIGIGTLMLYVAFRLGAFKSRHADKFREDLSELETFKKMSGELKAEK